VDHIISRHSFINF